MMIFSFRQESIVSELLTGLRERKDRGRDLRVRRAVLMLANRVCSLTWDWSLGDGKQFWKKNLAVEYARLVCEVYAPCVYSCLFQD